jgi:aspartate/methionine/tyrosine aminotransferase
VRLRRRRHDRLGSPAATDALCRRLREGHETTVVPGRFFGAPGHFRLALGCAPETLEGGLARLATALDEMRSAASGTSAPATDA